MDDRRFDTLTKHLAVSGTRRQLLGGLVAGALGFVRLGRADGASCRAPGSVCREGANCCSGLCSEVGASRRKQCTCPPGAEQCKDVCADPATAYRSDPNNCGACGVTCPRTRCNIGVCNAGVCELAPDPSMVGVACDDGNPCTENDVCQGDGTCAGTLISCSVDEPKCQTATCNPATGQCETTNLPLGTNCADDDRCDGEEACDGNGVCAAGTPVQCQQPSDPCQSATCDSASGQCVTTNAHNGLACSVDFIPNGVCCSGICSQCCGDANPCTSLFAETDNVVFFCDDPAQVGNLNCRSECDSSVIPSNNPICTDPAVVGSVNQQCGSGGQSVPCLNCRLPVGSQCSTDTQCCGFCVNGICQEGAVNSPCVDSSDCASGLFCNAQSVCSAPLAIGVACDPTSATCVTGASCGSILQTSGTFCCLPIGAACSADENCCQDGGVQERCILGVCKTRVGDGEACGKDFDCRAGLACLSSGTCGSQSPLGGTCDSNLDCAFDATSNTRPICSSGTCKLPNGSACTSGDLCAIGTCLDCTYHGGGHICAECCRTGGEDFVDCGDGWNKICCDHQCVDFISDTHCGRCDVDCTCDGQEPQRYCQRIDTEDGLEGSNATCLGSYTNGHCTHESVCSTDCTNYDECTEETNYTNLFCFARLVGGFDDLELDAYCGETGKMCFDGDDETCCNAGDVCKRGCDTTGAATFCFTGDYLCYAT